ncbi:hypothetical protein [Pirellula sp. SH-Sr6A]|uniref:hypothetical protein n=1 Tax=Pirellula sp. SH-Sr6A TaxID=1632865 RepID=UPI0011BA617E|nr:hypothetical protein [Pirellula sp. SH-Sr6A]
MKLFKKCCSCCDSSVNPDISQMSFSSLDGLHPVSFSATPIRVAKNQVASFGITPGFEIVPPSSANNASCPWPSTPSSDFHNSGSRNIGSDIAANCCWAAVAVPSTPVSSAGQEYRYRWSFESTVVNDKLWRATVNHLCTTDGFEWQDSTRTSYYDLVTKRHLIAKRYLFAVGVKACWVDSQIQLTARVWYKDWRRLSNFSFFRERFISSGSATFTGYRSDLGTCGPKTGLAASDFWTCGSSTRPTEPDWLDGINVSNCLDCSTSTGLTDATISPLNCNMEFADRTMTLPTGVCSVAGTHVFSSGFGSSPKYDGSFACITSSLLPCTWRYPTPKCPLGVDPYPVFPVPIDETKPVTGNVDFDEYDEVQTVDTAEDEFESGVPVVMNWWTEPWTITIS